jgi:hypothetical protein
MRTIALLAVLAAALPALALAQSTPVGPPVAPAPAPNAKPAALAGLETMVANLGYATTDAANNQSFSITWVGKYNYVMTFDVSTDNSLAYAFVLLGTYTPSQLGQMQYVKLLEQDDTGDYFYSAESANAGAERIYANIAIPVAALTPAYLRGLLTGMSNKMDAADAIWNTTLWK